MSYRRAVPTKKAVLCLQQTASSASTAGAKLKIPVHVPKSVTDQTCQPSPIMEATAAEAPSNVLACSLIVGKDLELFVRQREASHARST